MINKLLKSYDNSTIIKSDKIEFRGVDGYDVYNITAPFMDTDNIVIAGRVEKRDSEHSKVIFFKKLEDNIYEKITSYPSFELQDPYFTFIDDELIFGGTKIYEVDGVLNYYAVKYRGKDVNSLVQFFEGPDKMKDIRLKQLSDGRIICFTRPQGSYGGRGTIGYTFFKNLDSLNKKQISEAPLIKGMIDIEEWCGANEIHQINDNELFILGHIARYDENNDRNYYAMSFIFNLDTLDFSKLKIILKREDLASGEYKRADLIDVIFSGGLVFNDELVDLYVGVSDAEAHHVVLNKNETFS